jgi:integrase
MAPSVVHVMAGRSADDSHDQFCSCSGGQGGRHQIPRSPHMLRHATGFYLANAGQDTRAIQLYLGHKNIQHTVRYTELLPQRFKDFWKD